MTLTEDNIGDYADMLVLQARDRGLTLDYSSESISRLEDLIRLSDDLLRGDGFPEAQRNLVVFYVGCYLGETLARNYGGVWHFDPNWFESTLLFNLPDGGLQLRPFHKAHYRVVVGVKENELTAYRDGVKARVQAD